MPKCKPHTVYIYDVLSKNGDVKMNLAEKLIYLRKKQGLTQLELAEKMDVSRQAVSRWEGGDAVPGTANLRTLSEIYHVSLDYLLNDVEDKEQIQSDNMVEFENKDHKQRKVWRKQVTVGLLVLAIMSIVCGTIYHGQNSKRITSISELTVETESNDSYQTETFKIK